ncbi:MAG TPA: glycine cleavage T C-terminal barrel domain-containing protein [Patescibacteria group bacterium]|nr:glycine cleavage T C-terminal barrel domain-containing protein [Patescibacteria group bacterium]
MPIESPLREKHERAGAAMGVWFGTQLPAGYGDSAAEYRHARETVAVADTNFQLIAELTGPDRVRYLNAVTTANIQDLESGRSAIGLLLNSQAHILAELRTLALADRLTILSAAMVAERTLSTLDKFIIMDDVTLADRSGEWGTLALVGPGALAAAEELTGIEMDALAEGAHAEALAGENIPCRILRACSLGLPGVEWVVERTRIAGLWNLLVDCAGRHGGGPAGYRAIDALRLEAGQAWFGADFDNRTIPHEAGVELSHISYTKGCYTGQEIVERVRSRGQVNRRLVGLGFTGAAVPKPGSPLLAGEETVGAVTSAAFSPLAGRVIGLGYLRREFHAPGSRVISEQGEAEVIPLPLAGA